MSRKTTVLMILDGYGLNEKSVRLSGAMQAAWR